MSTLTKEWLLKTIAELEEERDAVPGAVNEDAANALAAMKLAMASLEAEAVAYVIQDRYERQNDDPGHLSRSHVTKYVSDDDIQKHEITCTPLYTAPPAPASVPEEMDIMTCHLDGVTETYAEGWNACRAAMLQGAEHVSNRDELTDGWVACSERMPEVGVKVLCFPVNDEPIHATYNGQVWLQDISWSTSDEPIDNVISCNVFHWMPLPAAPQQE